MVMSEYGNAFSIGEEKAPPLKARPPEPYCLTSEPIPINTQAIASRTGDVTNRVGLGIGKEGDPQNTLGANHCHGVYEPMQARVRKLKPNEGPYMLKGNMIGRSDNAGPQGKGYREDTAFTLNATDVQGVVAPALTTNDPSRSPRASEVTAQIASVFEVTARVRKLTPTECERLQGFPDGHTKIPYKGKPEELCPDSPRYKAIGNSWCVPCVRWIGQRIQDHLDGKI